MNKLKGSKTGIELAEILSNLPEYYQGVIMGATQMLVLTQKQKEDRVTTI